MRSVKERTFMCPKNRYRYPQGFDDSGEWPNPAPARIAWFVLGMIILGLIAALLSA